MATLASGPRTIADFHSAVDAAQRPFKRYRQSNCPPKRLYTDAQQTFTDSVKHIDGMRPLARPYQAARKRELRKAALQRAAILNELFRA